MAFAVLSLLAAGCSKYDDSIPEWPWSEPKGGPSSYIWIDASANFQYYANSVDNIKADLERVKKMGFTDIIVDVRPTEGTVLFTSGTAPATRRLAAWVGGSYKFVNRTETFDYLQAFIDAGHEVGLKVNAAINTFVGGYGGMYGLESEGPIFSGDIPASWATMQNRTGGIKSSFYDGVQGTVFLNPANDDVQDYMLSLLGELAEYDLDGIILDRCRYDDSGLQSDFSEISKDKFTDYLGKQPTLWPVFQAGASSLPSTVSDEQRSWLAFRVKVIHDFIVKAADTVHSVDPDIRFGVYVGAWYSDYYTSGVNWASPDYPTAVKYPKWANKDYQECGFADHCDFMMLGCYASANSITGSGEWTIQGFARQGRTLLCGDTEFAGGPDIGNPEGWNQGNQGDKLSKVVEVCFKEADGLFVFDLCHVRMYDYWDAFEAAFEENKK